MKGRQICVRVLPDDVHDAAKTFLRQIITQYRFHLFQVNLLGMPLKSAESPGW
jgi:hypothetical protein